MRTTIAVSLAVLFFSCGSSSKSSIPQADACNQATTAVCAKLFSCTNDPILMQAQTVVGGTMAMCQTTLQNGYCTPFLCDASVYRGDKAQECKDQFATVTCATLSGALAAAFLGGGGTMGALMAVLTTAPSCAQVCPAADAGGGG